VVDRAEFERWRDEGRRALEGARVQAKAELHNWACFLAEQASQLAVKAFLHGLGRAPWGHDLVRLGSQVTDAVGGDWGLDAVLRRLSRHYIPARHPDAHPAGSPGAHYGAEDSEQGLADAEQVLAAVDRLWRVVVREGERDG
jgi:HEPN domain-containing protein